MRQIAASTRPCRPFGLLAAASLLAAVCHAQAVKPAPATDSAAQASPIGAPHNAAATDASAQASPLLGANPHPAAPLPGGYTLTVRLDQAADSGSLRNGQTLRGTLIQSQGVTSAAKLQTETPVELTVIAAVPAGKIYAAGELSLALSAVGKRTAFTDILTFRGTPGHRDLPDSAPALGTNAGLPSGTTLVFHSQGSPTPAGNATRPGTGIVPGSVNATVGGSAGQPAPGAKP